MKEKIVGRLLMNGQITGDEAVILLKEKVIEKEAAPVQKENVEKAKKAIEDSEKEAELDKLRKELERIAKEQTKKNTHPWPDPWNPNKAINPWDVIKPNKYPFDDPYRITVGNPDTIVGSSNLADNSCVYYRDSNGGVVPVNTANATGDPEWLKHVQENADGYYSFVTASNGQTGLKYTPKQTELQEKRYSLNLDYLGELEPAVVNFSTPCFDDSGYSTAMEGMDSDGGYENDEEQ